MPRRLPALLACLALCLILWGAERPAWARMAVTAQVGTLGAEVELTLPVTGNFAARLGASALIWKFDASASDLNYDFDMNLYTLGAFLDWHPMGGGFRVTVGAIFANPDMTAEVGMSRTGRYMIGSHNYPGVVLGGLDAEVDLPTVAPYVGVGYSDFFSPSQHWSFSLDVGVIYWGKPDVTIRDRSPYKISYLQEDLRKEEKEIEDELDRLTYYPVLAVGISYNF